MTEPNDFEYESIVKKSVDEVYSRFQQYTPLRLLDPVEGSPFSIDDGIEPTKLISSFGTINDIFGKIKNDFLFAVNDKLSDVNFQIYHTQQQKVDKHSNQNLQYTYNVDGSVYDVNYEGALLSNGKTIEEGVTVTNKPDLHASDNPNSALSSLLLDTDLYNNNGTLKTNLPKPLTKSEDGKAILKDGYSSSSLGMVIDNALAPIKNLAENAYKYINSEIHANKLISVIGVRNSLDKLFAELSDIRIFKIGYSTNPIKITTTNITEILRQISNVVSIDNNSLAVCDKKMFDINHKAENLRSEYPAYSDIVPYVFNAYDKKIKVNNGFVTQNNITNTSKNGVLGSMVDNGVKWNGGNPNQCSPTPNKNGLAKNVRQLDAKTIKNRLDNSNVVSGNIIKASDMLDLINIYVDLVTLIAIYYQVQINFITIDYDLQDYSLLHCSSYYCNERRSRNGEHNCCYVAGAAAKPKKKNGFANRTLFGSGVYHRNENGGDFNAHWVTISKKVVDNDISGGYNYCPICYYKEAGWMAFPSGDTNYSYDVFASGANVHLIPKKVREKNWWFNDIGEYYTYYYSFSISNPNTIYGDIDSNSLLGYIGGDDDNSELGSLWKELSNNGLGYLHPTKFRIRYALSPSFHTAYRQLVSPRSKVKYDMENGIGWNGGRRSMYSGELSAGFGFSKKNPNTARACKNINYTATLLIMKKDIGVRLFKGDNGLSQTELNHNILKSKASYNGNTTAYKNELAYPRLDIIFSKINEIIAESYTGGTETINSCVNVFIVKPSGGHQSDYVSKVTAMCEEYGITPICVNDLTTVSTMSGSGRMDQNINTKKNTGVIDVPRNVSYEEGMCFWMIPTFNSHGDANGPFHWNWHFSLTFA